MKQLAFRLPERGGKRRGAGRKPNGRRALVSHKARPGFAKRSVVLVTLRVADHVWNLRSRRCFRLIRASLEHGRFGLRVIDVSVLGNHLHLIVEADTSEALSRGMQGLCIRVAKALNRLMKRSGGVFADHYHSRLLTTPAELVNALGYLLGNAARHYGGSPGGDPFTLRLAPPQTWLLLRGWRRARRIPHWMDPCSR